MRAGPRPEVLAFLRDIKANPEDDTPRLVLGDWLQENGLTETERARGEFLYLQCRFVRMPEDDSHWVATRARLHELRGMHELAWAGRWWAWAEWWAFRRGLLRPSISRLGGLGERGLTEPDACLWVDALRIYPLGASEVLPLVQSPCLGQLNSLNLSRNRRGERLARALAGSYHLGNLTHLNLQGNTLGDAGALALARAPRLASLTHLNLRSNGIGNRGARALADSPCLTRLASLFLDDNDIERESLEAIEARFGKILDEGILDR